MRICSSAKSSPKLLTFMALISLVRPRRRHSAGRGVVCLNPRQTTLWSKDRSASNPAKPDHTGVKVSGCPAPINTVTIGHRNFILRMRANRSRTRLRPPVRKALAVWTEVVAVWARQRRKAAAVRTEIEAIRAPERRDHLERCRHRRINIEWVVAHTVAVGTAVKVEPAKVAHQRHSGRRRLLRRGRNREGLDVKGRQRPQ